MKVVSDFEGVTCEHMCPVFRSRFRILAENHDDSDSGKSLTKEEKPRSPGKAEITSPEENEDESNQGNVEPFLDEDGDLDVTHRYER